MKLRVEKTDEILTPNSGLAVAGALIKSLKIGRGLDKIKLSSDEPEISNQDVFRSYIGLLLMERTNYEDIGLFRDDGIFRIMLDIKKVPSPGTLRQRFDAARGAFDKAIRDFNVALLKRCRVSPVVVDSGEYIPVDIDVSPFDNSGSKKEGVSWTYKKHEGYSPNFAYVGVEGYMANCELRPGSQHCQKNTPEFIRETIGVIDEVWGLERKFLFRFDSGNDSDENILEFKDKKDRYFIIKRNLRKESLEGWLEIAMEKGEMAEPRPGKKVWHGHVFRNVEGYGSVKIVFNVVERTIDRKGQAFNILRKIGCDLLSFPDDLPVKLDIGRRRIRSVIQNIVNVAGKLVGTDGRTILKISERCSWFDPFGRLLASYC